MWARPWLPSKPSSAPRRQAAWPGASQSGSVSNPLLPGASSLASALRVSSRRAASAGGSFPCGPSSTVRYQLTVHMPRRIPVLSYRYFPGRGMWTVSWYRTVLEGPHGKEPPAEAARLEDTLNAEASELAPGSNGLLTLPDWLAPGHAAWRRGALLGFDGSQGRAHIYRSILEGIALTMANHTAAMEQALGRRLSPVLVSGGGSSSDLMMQIVADV